MELIWDKGDASALVLYTDAIFWESNAVKGGFDDRHADGWDVERRRPREAEGSAHGWSADAHGDAGGSAGSNQARGRQASKRGRWDGGKKGFGWRYLRANGWRGTAGEPLHRASATTARHEAQRRQRQRQWRKRPAVGLDDVLEHAGVIGDGSLSAGPKRKRKRLGVGYGSMVAGRRARARARNPRAEQVARADVLLPLRPGAAAVAARIELRLTNRSFSSSSGGGDSGATHAPRILDSSRGTLLSVARRDAREHSHPLRLADAGCSGRAVGALAGAGSGTALVVATAMSAATCGAAFQLLRRGQQQGDAPGSPQGRFKVPCALEKIRPIAFRRGRAL